MKQANIQREVHRDFPEFGLTVYAQRGQRGIEYVIAYYGIEFGPTIFFQSARRDGAEIIIEPSPVKEIPEQARSFAKFIGPKSQPRGLRLSRPQPLQPMPTLSTVSTVAQE